MNKNKNLSYCLKCKDKKEMNNVQLKTNKRGIKYLQGNCKDCNCKTNCFIKNDSKIDVINKDSSNDTYSVYTE